MKVILVLVFVYVNIFAQKSMLPESTVAVVNGIAISEHALDKEVEQELPNTYYHATLNEEKLKKFKTDALEKLIEKNLLYSYSLSKNITVSDDYIDEIIESIDKLNESGALEKKIKQLGYTMITFKKTVKKDEVLKMLYEKEIAVTLSDEELKEYYEKNKYKFKEPEKVRVRLIYIKNDPQDKDGKTKADERLKLVLKEIKTVKPKLMKD